MTENDTHEPEAASVETDGGVATQTARAHQETNYLDNEVNILNPTTPFMRDHLRIIWTGFIIWIGVVFGPVTLTAIAPGVMTTQLPVIGFPLHYFLIAIGAPTGGLILSYWYVRRRDQLDEKYGIRHTTTEPDRADVSVADGGDSE